MTDSPLPDPIPLWPAGTPGVSTDIPEQETEPSKFHHIFNPTLTAFEPPREQRNGTAIVVCPGGGYGMVSCANEGWPVARWLNGLGICAYILKYRVPGHGTPQFRHPAPMTDVQRAIRMVRDFAEPRRLLDSHIGILGFSAGGHLAASASTWFDTPIQPDPISCRPDFSILVYPVITFVDEPVCHTGSRNNLIGPDPSEDLKRRLSPELGITPRTPPAFLAHARDDRAVDAENSRLYHDALRAAGVGSTLRLYDTGGHGFGMGSPQHDSSQWPTHCEEWLKDSTWI